MLGHVRALRGKVDAGRDRLARMRERNDALVAENERLEAEVEELLAQRARLERRPKLRERGGGGGLPPGGGLDDDVEFVEVDEDVDIVADADSQLRARGLFACLAHLGRRMRQRLRALEARALRRLPILRSVARLSTRYGASMAVYFSFCAWLTLNASVQLLIYLPLLIMHAYDALSGAASATPFETALFRPIWWVWYSSFEAKNGALYTACCSVSLLVQVLISARKFIAERRAAQYVEVYGLGADKMRFARAVLNGWDMQVASASALSEARAATADRLRLLVDEGERAARIAARSSGERNVLRARRFLGIVVSMAYTVGAWAGITGLQLNALALSGYLEAQAAGLSLLAVVGVPVVVSTVNAILPILTMVVTRFERWDSPTTTLRVQVFRLYLGKILNLLINVAGYGILLARQNSTPRGALALARPGGGAPFTVALVEPNNSRFGCAENQIGTMLLLFVAVEFVIDKAVSAARAYSARYALPLLTGRPWSREPFPTAQKVINLIYFQALPALRHV
ncbi:hypothetical protein KFE25_002288 [Diacronema lutheri]|uniref:TMC domain-containing protein n=2 Tax=Diacronema lutheri TaxID=2081491 RepID=A0A8J5X7N3_DIALT|nr:hypothetical protein KFE25_002288 [Diacronema lutheri]